MGRLSLQVNIAFLIIAGLLASMVHTAGKHQVGDEKHKKRANTFVSSDAKWICLCISTVGNCPLFDYLGECLQPSYKTERLSY